MPISIYDAKKLNLKEGDPLYSVLYMCYTMHIEIEESVARAAAATLNPNHTEQQFCPIDRAGERHPSWTPSLPAVHQSPR